MTKIYFSTGNNPNEDRREGNRSKSNFLKGEGWRFVQENGFQLLL